MEEYVGKHFMTNAKHVGGSVMMWGYLSDFTYTQTGYLTSVKHSSQLSLFKMEK